MEERRRFQRLNSRTPIWYKSLEEFRRPHSGTLTMDVGEGGLKLTTNEFIPRATRLSLEFTLPSTSRPIRAISRVVWVQKVRYSDRYEMGVEFIELGPEDESYLKTFLFAELGSVAT